MRQKPHNIKRTDDMPPSRGEGALPLNEEIRYGEQSGN